VIFDSALGVQGAPSSLFLTQVANGAHVGVFLLASWAIANRSLWIYTAIGVTVLLFVGGMLTLAKSEAILPVIMLSLAFIYERKTIRTTIIASASVYLLFLAISEPVSYARQAAGTAPSGFGFGAQSIGERIRIYLAYPTAESQAVDEDIQNGWARLSYVNGGTFAINQYDAGQPGDSYEHLLIVWLPRVIYPDKPNLTEKARDFNLAVSGSDSSQATPGMPSEGYWNFGWLGVIVTAAAAAAIFALWSYYTVLALQSGAWHLLLVILLGMRVGTRIDGMFVTDIVGPVGYAVLGHIALTFLNRLIKRSQRKNRRPGALARA
jgi:hypothetical protein